MMIEPIEAFRAAEYQVKFATCPWERERAHALRQAVFCREQGIFRGSDRDAVDDTAIPIVALSMLGVVADDVVGTVRIHEPEPGLWWGSRLAVHRDYRKIGALGATLIRLAVSSAHAMGAHTFLAHVQVQNALLFRRLHWRWRSTASHICACRRIFPTIRPAFRRRRGSSPCRERLHDNDG